MLLDQLDLLGIKYKLVVMLPLTLPLMVKLVL